MKSIAYEKLRKQLIDKQLYKRALKTYSTQQVFLPDNNTGEFWDEKFLQNDENHLMEVWRINYVISKIPNGSKILNLGVGSGKLERKLSKSKKQLSYVGTDITNSSLKKLAKDIKEFKFIKTNLDNTPFSDNSFDIVLLLEVLEHIRPDLTFQVLEEISRLLKRNGMLIISVPLNEGLERMLPWNPNSHQRFYSEKLLTFELIQTGFEIESVKKVSAFRNFFWVKNFINDIFALRNPNNLVITCRKK